MNVWVIGTACLLGAGFIAWGAARLRMRWPLAALSVLLAAIATQLFLATRGQDGMHDLAALIAQALTVTPALLGVATGLILARLRGHPLPLRGLPGVISALGLLVAGAVAAMTFLI